MGLRAVSGGAQGRRGFPSGAVIFISLVERHTYKPKQSLVLQQHLRYN